MYHHQPRSDDAGAKKLASVELRKQLERETDCTSTHHCASILHYTRAGRGDDARVKKITLAEPVAIVRHQPKRKVCHPSPCTSDKALTHNLLEEAWLF